MPLVRFRAHDAGTSHLGWLDGESIAVFPEDSGYGSIRQVLQQRRDDLYAGIEQVRRHAERTLDLAEVTLLMPLDDQEIWAAGVTYRRSRDARMEESTEKSVYDRVYDAERPEIFLKATPRRVVGPGGTITVRSDSGWDVPEPELALAINRHGEIVGYTVGNDVSSRAIEGENPLYLPQAKIYTGSAALGPGIAFAFEVSDADDMRIALRIERNDEPLFEGETTTANLHRRPHDLVSWLFRGNDFPDGVFLMTGTGIVPPDEVTLTEGDVVRITIDGIGTLSNRVATLSASQR